MKAYAANYAKADVRVIKSVVNNFTKFLAEKKLAGLTMKDFSESIAQQFRDRLKKDCIGEGAKSYYNRFRKIVKQAYRDRLLAKNPCEFIEPPRGEARIKDVLTFEELQLVANTVTEAPQVKRAFLFCTMTGLRFVDVKALTWEAIDLNQRIMKVKQSKTGKVVTVSLNSTAVDILGQEAGKKTPVFILGSSNGCNKSLASLVKRAGIKKHITFHCGRHSFGTNLVYFGTDIHTTSRLLGHASLAQTNRYVRASRELAEKAVDSLPKINL
jgi:site-specific recombinase XerD